MRRWTGLVGKLMGRSSTPGSGITGRISITRRSLLSGTLGAAGGAILASAAAGAARPRAARDPGLPRGEQLLIKGGCVLTLDPDLGDYEQADVLIDGSRIAEVGPDLEAGGEVIDASGMIVMPGFVDTHRHMWQGALRSILPDGLLGDYVRTILAARTFYRPEDVHIGNLVSALGAIDAGITTVLDWSHIGNSPAHTDAAIHGLHESGIRAVYAFGNGVAGRENRFPEDIKRLRTEHFSSNDAVLTLAMAAGIDTSQWDLAREVGARISVHVNGSGQLLPVADALGPDITCIHCTNLLDEEWALLAEKGASVSIAGPIEMQMGHGVPPIQQALDHGIRPSLSVDVETQMAGDFFRQMLSAFTLQRMQILARAAAGESNLPDLLTVREVVELATIQGAHDNGLGQKTGSLTPGKEADVILINMNRINVMPVNNAYGALVHGMDTGNVDSVFIGGKVRKWHGHLVDVDLDRIHHSIHESRDHIVASAGWPPTVLNTAVAEQ